MRILLAEDERSLSRAIAAILRHADYEVETVFDGAQALAALSTANFDAAVLDIMMPQHDGLEVLRCLRERGDRTPVLLLTALSAVDDKVQGLDCGANDYLTKPFAARELLARIRAMTRQEETPCLTLGNISLDRSTLSLSSPTGSFRLAKKEFQVIELLLCNAGHPIAADRLRERIWNEEGADTEIVLVYISYLRNKLSALHATVHIRADDRGAYLLEADA